MRKALPLLITFILISGSLLAGATLQYFTARTNNDGVFIEWKTSNENGVQRFELERSAGNTENFIYIESFNAKGSNSYYSYQDNSVDMRNNDIYYYRLKNIESNGSHSYSYNISVIHSVSGIRSTWGSIKAIFR
ncbi:MAG TPA: hypothetical protein VHP32_11680 [Ignavibacteria bacterium]|nr:hypothetical protein [Ignavibacteria bacterium]